LGGDKLKWDTLYINCWRRNGDSSENTTIRIVFILYWK